MQYQWYPGHMTKAKRQMQEDIKLVDLVIELVDARIPISSHNPDIDTLGRQKARMVLLNKADLADEAKNKAWCDYYKKQGIFAVRLDARNRGGMKDVQSVIQDACREKIERNLKRGIINRPVWAMVAGIPNVGESTFINSFAGKACAKTGNKPGVTKGKQWIRLNKQVELLDTPGILWPKFENQIIGMHLAYIGSIRDEIVNREELAFELLKELLERYPGLLADRFALSAAQTPLEALEQVAKNRSCLKKGGELDTEKAAAMLLEEFRSGKLGRITMEEPRDNADVSMDDQ